MSQFNIFEALESRVFMSVAQPPSFQPPAPTAPHVVLHVPIISLGNASLTAPSVVKAQSLVADQMLITWQGDTGATHGYTIQRSSNGRTGWANVGVRATDARSFIDSNLTQSTRYFYRIIAQGNNGQIAYSGVFVGYTHRV